MSRDTYVAYNAYFDSGGPWGLLGSFYAAYIEAKIQRPFRSLVDVLSGSSMGGLNAESLAADAAAARLMYSTYACSMDMIDRPSSSLVRNQIINKGLGRNFLVDHYNHTILRKMLEMHFGERTMGELPISLLVSAHNMTKKRDELLGCLHSDLFDISALKIPLVNGSTPLMDGAMATTSIPGVFEPHLLNGSHYRDNGAIVSAGQIHKELDAAIKARQRVLHAAIKGSAVESIKSAFGSIARHTFGGARTLASTDNAVVRTLFFGTGDLSDMPYDHARQQRAGFMAAVSPREYSSLHATKRSTQEQDRRDMERHYDPQTIAATGSPAITSFNRSIIPRSGTDEIHTFPSSNPMDCTPANLHKVFYVAALNVADNTAKLAGTLHEIATTRFAQGSIDQAEHTHLRRAADQIGKEDPWPVLNQLMVTDTNGQGIYRDHSQKHRKDIAWPHMRKAVARQLPQILPAVA